MKQEIKYAELILEIINSEKFKYNLEKLNSFYANLKYVGTNTEVISSKGKSALGKSFYVVNDQNILNGSFNPSPMNYQASITAYSDNTKIKISGYDNGLVFTDGSKNSEINITH